MVIDEIKKHFKDMGVQLGDSLVVSSDIRALLPLLWHESKHLGQPKKSREEYMTAVITAIQELVGTEGTLLFPTFFWGFCHGEGWSMADTPGETGTLSNFALKMPGFKRTQHPLYSFAVWGKKADFYASLTNVDSFSDDSPFRYLYDDGAKNIAMGTDNFFTFQHYVEQSLNVAYRYNKNFTAPYKATGGEWSDKTYTMFVRQLDPEVVSSADKMLAVMEREGAALRRSISNIPLLCIDYRHAYTVLADDIEHNEARNIVYFLEKNDG